MAISAWSCGAAWSSPFNSGETEEIARMLPSLKRLGIQIISLTGNKESTLAKNSDVVLDVGVKEEACPLGLAPTASTTAALAMGDALAVALLDRRGFRPEDFACFHPGGALGKRLLISVRDLMHKETSRCQNNIDRTLFRDLVENGRYRILMRADWSRHSDGDLRRWMKDRKRVRTCLRRGDIDEKSKVGLSA
jgi:arabinose-5-phosphate isomerase